MAQLILSPNSTSIMATLNGLTQASIPRVVQFFLDSVNAAPKAEILIPAGSVQSSYIKAITGLKTNAEYTVIVRVIDDRTTEVVLEEYTEKATCGGTSKDPSFSVRDISSNSAIVELYRGSPIRNYYRLYVYDTVDEEAIFTDWLKPDSYPKQLAGLESGRLYKINVGYGDIYGGGVTWIGTQTFTTGTEFDTGHSDEGEFTMPDAAIPRNVIGTKAGSLKTSSFNNTYSRVTITTKDSESSSDIAYSVGNDDGLEMVVACPWIGADEHAAIKMATYILSTLNGYTYCPYTSSETLLDPAAELGDLISFDKITSEIVNLDIDYERIMNSEVSAPVSNETEHEFPQGASSKDSTKRYVDGVRAALELEIDKITALVENNEGRFQKLQVTLDGVIIQNEQGQTIINGAHIQTGTIELMDQMYNGGSFTNKVGSMESATSEAQGTASIAVQAAVAAQAAANAAQAYADDAYDLAASKPSTSRVQQLAATQIVNDLRDNFDITSENGHSVLTSSYLYSPNLVAGDIASASATINHLGILFGSYDSTTEEVLANYARLGYEEVGNMKLPILTLGQGGTSPTDGSGSFKKYTNGLWVGEYFADNNTAFDMDNATGVGTFYNTVFDLLCTSPSTFGPSNTRPIGRMKGQIYFEKVD